MNTPALHLVKGSLGTYSTFEPVVLLVGPAIGHTGDEMVLSKQAWQVDAGEIISREQDPKAALDALLLTVTPVKDAAIEVYIFKQAPQEEGQPIKWVYQTRMGSLARTAGKDKSSKHTVQELHAALSANEPKVGDFWPPVVSKTAGLNDVRFQRGEW